MESISYSACTVYETHTLCAGGGHLLDLLGVFVADEHNDGINVNTVEPFDGVRRDVEQTVTALHQNRENRTSVQRQGKMSDDGYKLRENITLMECGWKFSSGVTLPRSLKRC